jgi:hypothetical protein
VEDIQAKGLGCYDHNFLRVLPIFGEKIGVFSKSNVMITIFHKTKSSLSKKRHFSAKFFGENIFKIIISVPARTRKESNERYLRHFKTDETKPRRVITVLDATAFFTVHKLEPFYFRFISLCVAAAQSRYGNASEKNVENKSFRNSAPLFCAASAHIGDVAGVTRLCEYFRPLDDCFL